MNIINREWLSHSTGDPFADTGAWALEAFTKEHPDEDILQLIERVSKIYIHNWDGKINPFFLNSTITQPAFQGAERKLAETLKYFRGILENTQPYTEGYCRILGYQTKLFIAGRNNHILSGSGTFINFHHGFEPGVMLSKEALIRIFFVPLGALFLGNRVAVIGSNHTALDRYFVREIVRANLARIANGTSEGIYKSPYGNSANTLFEFVKKWTSEFSDMGEDSTEISLYHFTNFGASPEISIYSFSAQLFGFYRKVLKNDRVMDWQRFIRSHYRPSKEVVYREQDDVFLKESKKVVIAQIDEESVKGFYNTIYDMLLNGKNIRSKMTSWSAKQYKAQRPFKLFHIATLYQTFLYNMKEETLTKIESIADIVVNNSNKRKKWINALMRVKNDSTLRDFLLQLIREQNQNGESTPVIRLREFDRYFLSDGVFAKETRDLLLISIFEKLCDQNIIEDVHALDDDVEEAE